MEEAGRRDIRQLCGIARDPDHVRVAASSRNWPAGKSSVLFNDLGAGQTPQAMPAASAAATAAHLSQNTGRFTRRAAGALVVPLAEPDRMLSIVTSPISCRRACESLTRQANSSCRIGSGVDRGSADQSGSRSMTFAIVSAIVSPANAARPVSIS